MGTLFDQKPRNRNSINDNIIIREINEIEQISIETGWTVENILKLKEIHEMERANNLYIDNGDAHDEQIADIGEIIKRFVDLFERSFTPYGLNLPHFEQIAVAIKDLSDSLSSLNQD